MTNEDRGWNQRLWAICRGIAQIYGITIHVLSISTSGGCANIHFIPGLLADFIGQQSYYLLGP